MTSGCNVWDLEVPKETFRRSALNLMENSLSRKRKLQDVDTVDEELATTGDKGHDTDDESAIEEESASEEETGNETAVIQSRKDAIDERILSLSFIFVIQPKDCNGGFLNDARPIEAEIRNHFASKLNISTPTEAILAASRVDDLCHDAVAVHKFLAQEHANFWDNNKKSTAHFNIINSFTQYCKSFRNDHTAQDRNEYEFSTNELFKGNVYSTHKMSKSIAI
ncbi:hypothetical protein V8B55DRAFT_1448200 [Mucor lusitanicus]